MYQAKELCTKKNYCPGIKSMSNIVASHTCTAYLWGTLIVLFVMEGQCQ